MFYFTISELLLIHDSPDFCQSFLKNFVNALLLIVLFIEKEILLVLIALIFYTFMFHMVYIAEDGF